MSDNISSPIMIRKNSGEMVAFDLNKLRSALERSGATEEDAEIVISQVLAKIYEGITTHNIYKLAYRFLSKESQRAAGRYKLKKAMMELGPSGYPFEHFVARLLEQQGYHVKVGLILQGKCVTHEVDVVAQKKHIHLMVECKYHSNSHTKTDVKVPMYIHSRFNDLENEMKAGMEGKNQTFQGMLITNSRFTGDALQFGECAGLKMVSWNHPINDSLRDWIDSAGFHPITSLKTLKKAEKQALLSKGIVLCREIVNQPEILNDIISPERRIKSVSREAKSLL